MEKINVYYTSIAFNTQQLIDNLIKLADEKHNADANAPEMKAYQVSEADNPEFEDVPFVVIVPTYLNGVGINATERLTNPLGEWIEDNPYNEKLLGIIGIGSRRYGTDYVRTAFNYSNKFAVPMIAEMEIPSLPENAQKAYDAIIEAAN